MCAPYVHSTLEHPQKRRLQIPKLSKLPQQFSSLHKIAFLCFSNSKGGLELTTLRLAEELRQRGAETLVVTLPVSPLLQWVIDKQIAFLSLKPKIKYGDIFTARRLGILLQQREIEAVIVMRSADIHIAALAKIWYPKLRITYYQQMQSGINKHDFLHTWVYSHLDLWMTLTESMRASVLKHTHMNAEYVQVAHLGRDTNEFHPSAFAQDDARKMLQVPPQKIIVGMLGRLDVQKGQTEFIRSIPLIHLQYPDVRFVIAGDETEGTSGFKQKLLALVQALGVDDAVLFLPGMKDVRKFLAAIDIFVMPSYSETYGMVLIEAMAMQKPVIATNAGGVPEIIRPDQDGLLIAPRSSTELATAVLSFLQDNRRCRMFAQHARRRAVEAFDTIQCTDRMVTLLESLVR